MTNEEMKARDLSVLWHPCTQMKDHEWLPLVPMKSGKGVWLEDFDGNRYIDAVSSWWVNLFGHANPRINAALSQQADQLEHAMLAGFSHQPVIELSERLVEVTPAGLSRCFYADNGSSGIEAAMKMSYHYWRNKGEPDRTLFITLSGSYHGETLGALAVGNVALYRETYQPLLIETLTVEAPDAFNRAPGESPADYARRCFPEMERAIADNSHRTAAVIVEPLVQCANGMRMYDPVYLELLREACDRHGVHLIADEIAVGFGRTGTLFACEQADITPDFMVLSKGITAGYLPLSAVITTDDVYQAFYDDYENLTAFLHSHSYTGNALACAVALETLNIFRDDNVIEQNRHTASLLHEAFAPLADHPNVIDFRQRGMILALELGTAPGTPYPWQERRGLRVYQHSLTRQALLRPLGNVVYIMPPYVINRGEIDHLATVAAEGIDIATRGTSP
ncbi:MAG: adenosylmethionine--8-amino-7-oxononanoate transaminase [Pseudomonadota bacterium]